jgi:hypothetical protein
MSRNSRKISTIRVDLCPLFKSVCQSGAYTDKIGLLFWWGGWQPGLSHFLGGSAWIAISRPRIAGYGYPARANSPKIWDAPLAARGLDERVFGFIMGVCCITQTSGDEMEQPMIPALSHVLWIGGATDSGKSTAAQKLAQRHQLQVYH